MDGCDKPQRVAICVASYRRPERLHALLGALDAQRFEGDRPDLVLVVADNDEAQSALPVCEDARRWLSSPLRYVTEPRKGIPFARNATLRAAGDADWIAFVDDDEIPDPTWLATLLRVQRETDADVVTGPVVPRFEREPSRWMREGGFFESTHRPTGGRLDSAYTNNALLRARALDTEFVHFDEGFTFGVGEDAELFSRLHARGARIVWADEAVVYETIPVERARVPWLVRRGFAVGTAVTYIARCRRGWLRSAAEALSHAVWCLAKGLALAALHALGARARCVRGLELAGYGVGRIAGVAGVR
jgi:GT2 family glycosyltransferase